MVVRARPHAVDRFVERVRPGLGFEAGRRELERLCAEFGRRVPMPGWVHQGTQIEADAWVELSDGVVVPVVELPSHAEAITVLVRGGMSAQVRRSRRRAAAVRRAGKAGARRLSRRARTEQQAGRRRPAPDVDGWDA